MILLLNENLKLEKEVAFLKKKKAICEHYLLGLFYENASDPMNASGVSKSKMYASIISGN